MSALRGAAVVDGESTALYGAPNPGGNPRAQGLGRWFAKWCTKSSANCHRRPKPSASDITKAKRPDPRGGDRARHQASLVTGTQAWAEAFLRIIRPRPASARPARAIVPGADTRLTAMFEVALIVVPERSV